MIAITAKKCDIDANVSNDNNVIKIYKRLENIDNHNNIQFQPKI